jgi:hypothetical protein
MILVRVTCRELAARVDTVPVRHIQVEDDDVRPQPSGFFGHLCAVVDA